MRVLIFGDSITQGYWDVTGGWVDKVRKHYDELQLKDLNGRDEPTVFNLGISADSSTDVLNRFEFESKARTRHGNLPIIIVQIGINDSAVDEGTIRTSLEDYKANIKAIIEKAKSVSSKLVFVGFSSCDESRTMPVAWGDHIYTNEAIKKYEDAMGQVAKDEGAPFIPVFDKFDTVIKSGTDLLPDGLHPNEAGHQLIYDILKEDINKLVVTT